tara:strand:- start:43865 stop:44185 length:321 start_codon:yes stop_codon:yes gene_type:complete
MKNQIKIIALSTLLLSGFAVQALEVSKEMTTTEDVVAEHKELSPEAKQVIKTIENYPNSDLTVSVQGDTAIVKGTVMNGTDQKAIEDALVATSDFSVVKLEISVSE